MDLWIILLSVILVKTDYHEKVTSFFLFGMLDNMIWIFPLPAFSDTPFFLRFVPLPRDEACAIDSASKSSSNISRPSSTYPLPSIIELIKVILRYFNTKFKYRRQQSSRHPVELILAFCILSHLLLHKCYLLPQLHTCFFFHFSIL